MTELRLDELRESDDVANYPVELFELGPNIVCKEVQSLPFGTGTWKQAAQIFSGPLENTPFAAKFRDVPFFLSVFVKRDEIDIKSGVRQRLFQVFELVLVLVQTCTAAPETKC